MPLLITARVSTKFGQFSEDGLHEWMPFLIFCAKSRKRSQLPLLGWSLSRRWLTLCITMEVERRIAKQETCHYCCVCKSYRGKWKRMIFFYSLFLFLLHRFGADHKIASSWKNMLFCCCCASYSTSNNLLLVARHILTTGLQKCP